MLHEKEEGESDREFMAAQDPRHRLSCTEVARLSGDLIQQELFRRAQPPRPPSTANGSVAGAAFSPRAPSAGSVSPSACPDRNSPGSSPLAGSNRSSSPGRWGQLGSDRGSAHVSEPPQGHSTNCSGDRADGGHGAADDGGLCRFGHPGGEKASDPLLNGPVAVGPAGGSMDSRDSRPSDEHPHTAPSTVDSVDVSNPAEHGSRAAGGSQAGTITGATFGGSSR